MCRDVDRRTTSDDADGDAKDCLVLRVASDAAENAYDDGNEDAEWKCSEGESLRGPDYVHLAPNHCQAIDNETIYKWRRSE